MLDHVCNIFGAGVIKYPMPQKLAVIMQCSAHLLIGKAALQKKALLARVPELVGCQWQYRNLFEIYFKQLHYLDGDSMEVFSFIVFQRMGFYRFLDIHM